MTKLWSGLKKRLVVDIGSSAVRVCELSKTKTGYEITRFAQREYDSDPSIDEAQRKELRVSALQDALKAVKVKKGKVVLGVPGQSVFTRCRTLPPVPEYKVDQIVRYEIQQQIPFGLDQIAMDYQILSRTEQGGYDVMMAAIKVDVVEKHIEPLIPLKCDVSAVDVLPLASYNWVRHQRGFGEQGECVALINMGASTTDIVIERGNQFRFTRPLNVGGNDITRAFAEAFNMDFASAERIKRERAFAPTGDPKRDGTGGEVVGRLLERLAGEIQRSFSYFRSQPGGGQVDRVLLTGGGACLKNLAPYLSKRLDMDVRIAQTLTNIPIAQDAQSIKEHPEQVADVLGMALRSCDTVTIDVDLIPPRILEAARQKEQIKYWAGSVVALILIFASMVPAASRENERVKERIEELKGAIHAYDPELGQLIRPGASLP
ncbi:MAG: type IV pilus assembly protein PilM, partial [Candidatus Hydrogenedentes bacterium]|nr:type IV pilus assembly protein PilM [Candidatus Hydrogenedentota bacterium]